MNNSYVLDEETLHLHTLKLLTMNDRLYGENEYSCKCDSSQKSSSKAAIHVSSRAKRTGWSQVKAVFTQLNCSGSHYVYLKAVAKQMYKNQQCLVQHKNIF